MNAACISVPQVRKTPPSRPPTTTRESNFTRPPEHGEKQEAPPSCKAAALRRYVTQNSICVLVKDIFSGLNYLLRHKYNAVLQAYGGR